MEKIFSVVIIPVKVKIIVSLASIPENTEFGIGVKSAPEALINEKSSIFNDPVKLPE